MERIPGAPDFSGKRVAGRYLCERLIGRGGMAVVYAAHDSVSDSRVALKLLITEDKGAEQARRSRELFYREYHALSHFDHPRIVAVREMILADDPKGRRAALAARFLMTALTREGR